MKRSFMKELQYFIKSRIYIHNKNIKRRGTWTLDSDNVFWGNLTGFSIYDFSEFSVNRQCTSFSSTLFPSASA